MNLFEANPNDNRIAIQDNLASLGDSSRRVSASSGRGDRDRINFGAVSSLGSTCTVWAPLASWL